MRRLLVTAVLLPVLACALVALPTITTSATATPRPVPADLEQVLLTGVDRAALSSLGGRTGAGSLRRSGTAEPALLSAPLTGKHFSLMGVTWRQDAGVDDVAVQVRHRSNGRWSGWEDVEAEGADGPDAGSVDTARPVRSGTAPIWTGPSDGVQVRVDVRSGARPQDVRIELVDPGTSPADAAPPVPRGVAHAAAPRPEIVSRAEWGADESIRRGSPSYTTPPKVGFVHHTASSNDYSPAQAAAMVRGIYAYHVKSNGWSDIGYNVLVDRYGRAYEGRAGGIDRAVLGAHTGGFNVASFGVSLLGDFSTVPPSTATLGTLSRVLAWKLGAAYRNPTGTAVLTSAGGGTSKYPAGAQVTFDVVSGHRDAGRTSCPGATTYARMPAIRQAVAAELGAAFVGPTFEGSPTQPFGSPGPVRVRAGTVGGLAWSGTVVDPRGTVLRRVTGAGGEAALTWDLTDAAGRPVRGGTYVLRLDGSGGGEAALPFTRSVVVEPSPCRRGPLGRAMCTALLRAARR